MPCQAFYECVFFVFLFSAENVRCLKTQISTKIQKAKYPTKKKQETKKTHSLKARRGHAKHVCKIAGSNSQKRRGPWHLKQFWVLFLNQPVNWGEKRNNRNTIQTLKNKKKTDENKIHKTEQEKTEKKAQINNKTKSRKKK